MRIHKTLLAVGTAGMIALAGAGCGGDDKAEDAVNTLQQQGEKLQERGQALQDKAARLQQQFRDGDITAEQLREELERDARALQEEATDATGDAIENLQDADIPDEAKDQLEEAQRQLEDATR
jgi:hypothetical protein